MTSKNQVSPLVLIEYHFILFNYQIRNDINQITLLYLWTQVQFHAFGTESSLFHVKQSTKGYCQGSFKRNRKTFLLIHSTKTDDHYRKLKLQAHYMIAFGALLRLKLRLMRKHYFDTEGQSLKQYPILNLEWGYKVDW